MSHFKRNEVGLVEGINYVYTSDGKIDWKKMFLPEHLYIKPDSHQKVADELGKPIEAISVTEVPDKYLISTLQGARYLCTLRGVESVSYNVITASFDYAAVQCVIKFLPNYEFPKGLEWSDTASASPRNTEKFMTNYLVETATNRAFCRAVRAALNIPVVSVEELSGKNDKGQSSLENDADTESSSPMRDLVINALKKQGITKYAQIVDRYNGKIDGLDLTKYKSVKEIPNSELLSLLGALK